MACLHEPAVLGDDSHPFKADPGESVNVKFFDRCALKRTAKFQELRLRQAGVHMSLLNLFATFAANNIAEPHVLLKRGLGLRRLTRHWLRRGLRLL